MEKLGYINYNGELLSSGVPVIGSSNRAFLYGDALFETMHANGTEVQFFDLHYTRLTESAKKLHFDLPSTFSSAFLQNEIRRLVQKNRSFKGSRIRVSLFRNDGGFYVPTTNQCSYVIEQSQLPSANYQLNTNGLVIDIFDGIKKPVNLLAEIKSANALLFVLSGIYKTNNQLDDCLLVNEKGNIIEAISSNLFLFSNSILYTPPLVDGCLPGIMRSVILSIAKKEGIQVEQTSIGYENLEQAEEVFLSNAVSGIRWVLGYKAKRYFNQRAKYFIDKINQEAYS
ncbi:MAG: aminotransferase class IV [Bacteroidales bacterium]|nr:aminotransferase class IV [Bacteroidales bacterium]MCF8456359.1 aminotransferase class IV [Bacteroidales bacterium]